MSAQAEWPMSSGCHWWVSRASRFGSGTDPQNHCWKVPVRSPHSVWDHDIISRPSNHPPPAELLSATVCWGIGSEEVAPGRDQCFIDGPADYKHQNYPGYWFILHEKNEAQRGWVISLRSHSQFAKDDYTVVSLELYSVLYVITKCFHLYSPIWFSQLPSIWENGMICFRVRRKCSFYLYFCVSSQTWPSQGRCH